MKTKILYLSVLCIFAGCATTTSFTPVAKDQIYADPAGRFSITAPEDEAVVAEINNGVIFSPEGGSDLNSPNPHGDYSVMVFPLSALPADVKTDLVSMARWIEDNNRSARAKAKMINLKEEPKDFPEQNALYNETFLPEIVKEGPANLTVIDAPAFQYANLVFVRGYNLYCLSYGVAVAGKYYFAEPLTPAVDSVVGQRLMEFAQGFEGN